MLPERQGNSDLRTNPGEEDMDIGYEDKPMLQIFEGLEQNFLDEILKLAKEQNDAEDAENAGHRELQEKELLLQSKEDSIKEQLQKNLDLEGKLKEAKSVAEELREAAKNVVEEHSTEIWKHKTALIELVSNQRQLEAEMGVRQIEAAKQDLDSEQSVSMTQKLSMELIKMRKDLEQKDTILSAILRKNYLMFFSSMSVKSCFVANPSATFRACFCCAFHMHILMAITIVRLHSTSKGRINQSLRSR